MQCGEPRACSRRAACAGAALVMLFAVVCGFTDFKAGLRLLDYKAEVTNVTLHASKIQAQDISIRDQAKQHVFPGVDGAPSTTTSIPTAEDTRPNVLIIIADDIPRDVHGPYGANHGLTPNVDTLAKQGLVFENAYTSAPLCTPSRFALLTGRHASNASSISASEPWRRVEFNTWLDGEGTATLAHAFRKHGYLTGLIGKYHLSSPQECSQGAYEGKVDLVKGQAGFEEVRAVWCTNKDLMSESTHHPEWMAQQAAEVVDRARLGEGKPFFLYFAGTVPHMEFSVPGSFEQDVRRTPAGVVPPQDEWRRTRENVLRSLQKFIPCTLHKTKGCRHGEPLIPLPSTSQGEYYRKGAETSLAGAAWFDSSAGLLLAHIDRRGWSQNTIVIYAGDHGPFYLGKGSPYENGVRVPLIMRWPSMIPASARSSQAVQLLDLYPTLLDAIGANKPASIHGHSLLPMVRSLSNPPQDYQPQRRAIFFEIGYARAVLRSPWKLVVVNDHDSQGRCARGGSPHCRNLHGLDWQGDRKPLYSFEAWRAHSAYCDCCQLYNILDDPEEQNNLIIFHPDVYEDLLIVIEAHVRTVEAGNAKLPSNLDLRQLCASSNATTSTTTAQPTSTADVAPAAIASRSASQPRQHPAGKHGYYARLSKGRCRNLGMDTIDSVTECNRAAQRLGLPHTAANITVATPRPERCYWQSTTQSLWYSINPANAGNGASGPHQPICKKKRTDRRKLST